VSILNKEKILEQARLFIQEGKYDKAIKEYEKILLADPDDMRVKLRIAELYAKRKQIGDAIRVYREVAEVYTQEGFYLKAVTVYKNVLRINPSLIEVNERLAELYEKMGLISDAIRQYSIYANALEHKGEMNKVLEIRRKIVDLAPEDGAARIRLAEIYQREGMSEESIDQYEEYAKRLESKGEDEARLIEMYEKILSHRSNRDDMLRALVKIYYRLGEKKKALKWLEFAKTLTPVDPELLKMQAEIYAFLNQAETARAKYLTLSDLCKENGDVDGVIDALASIVMLIPSEQERAEKRAEDIGPDAKTRLRAEIERRKADEEKRIRKEEEAEARASREEGEPEKQEEITEKAKKPESEQTLDLDRTVIIPVEKRAEKKPEEKPVATMQERLKRAKAAYDLGLFYKKIGLESDCKKELAKAYELYKDLENQSAEATVRISEIRLIIGEAKPQPKKPRGVAISKPRKTAEKEKEKTAERKTKKRKVSFV